MCYVNNYQHSSENKAQYDQLWLKCCCLSAGRRKSRMTHLFSIKFQYSKWKPSQSFIGEYQDNDLVLDALPGALPRYALLHQKTTEQLAKMCDILRRNHASLDAKRTV